MAESKNDLTENKKKRPNKLTNARIKKEIEFLEKMFVGVDDENKKTLINSLIEEAAFLKVACFQAKEELKKEGLTTETVNASFADIPTIFLNTLEKCAMSKNPTCSAISPIRRD